MAHNHDSMSSPSIESGLPAPFYPTTIFLRYFRKLHIVSKDEAAANFSRHTNSAHRNENIRTNVFDCRYTNNTARTQTPPHLALHQHEISSTLLSMSCIMRVLASQRLQILSMIPLLRGLHSHLSSLWRHCMYIPFFGGKEARTREIQKLSRWWRSLNNVFGEE